MSRLSLCLIVRDEADMLPDFLAAVDGLWDELVAVDTGSTDQTRELLGAAGARILERPWDDDFAAARNASVEPATGDWILFLDADERPSPELRDQIRALLTDETAGAATIRMRNHLPHGHVRESDLLRLWRRDPEIRFRHRIHEEVSSSIDAVLSRTGRRLVNLTALCDHLGYARDVATARAKKDRDLGLLTEAVKADPGDWYSWYKILEQARFWDDQELWHDTADSVITRLDGPPPESLEPAPWSGELIALAAQGRFPDLAKQLTWLDRWEDRVSPTAAFYLRRGMVREKLGRVEGAERDYQRCRELPAGTLPMLTTVRPLLGLCRLAAMRGELATAGDHVHQALAHNPRDPESLLAAVSFAWLHGGTEARDAFAMEHEELYGDSEELSMALGDHAVQSGLWADAEMFLGRIVGDPPAGRAALLLGQSLLARGEVPAAQDLCFELMDTLPQASMGFLTCCLVRGDQVEFSVDIEQDQADTALKEWIRVLWRSRRAPLMTAFIDHFPLVGQTFPWLPQFLTEETERLKRQLR